MRRAVVDSGGPTLSRASYHTSGCKVEELQHHEAERLERAMAIKMVVGWRTS